jgi:hypothetical protein
MSGIIRYFYVPFEDPSFVDMCKEVKIPANFRRVVKSYAPTKKNQLSWATRWDQVYVMGHGAPGADDIEDNKGTQLAINGIVDRLKHEGLSKNHHLIKLWACSGGAGGKNSTAYKLLKALRAAGYSKVKVAGYTETITTSVNGHKRALSHDDDSDVGRASEHRVLFANL